MNQTDKKQLKALQRAFVQKIMSSQDTWEPSIGETIVKGKELDWYASVNISMRIPRFMICCRYLGSGGMRHHMENAWTKPLIEDKAACNWLLSGSGTIQTLAVNTIPMGEVAKLAAQYTEAEPKLARKVLFGVVQFAETSLAEIMRCAKMLVEMVQAIPEAERDDEDNAFCFRSAFKLFIGNDMGSPLWILGYRALANTYESGIKFEALSMARVCLVHGNVCVGMTPLNLAPSTDELNKGYTVLRDSMVFFWRAYQSNEFIENIANHRCMGLCAGCVLGFWLCDIWTKPPTDEERAIWSRKEILQLAEEYDYGKRMLDMLHVNGT
jgi:hypothetical protein